MRAALILLPLLLLAGCNGGTGNDTAPVTSATAIASTPAPPGKTWVDVVTKTELGYRQGNPDAPVKLVEYGSRSCPTCGAFANAGVEPLRSKYISTGRVSYEFREFWVHPQDPALSLAGTCVTTEAFFPILDQMYATQAEFAARLTQEVFDQIQLLPRPQQTAAFAERMGYVDFLKQRGVPETRVRQCLGDAAALKVLEEQVTRAQQEKKIAGTPTFFINDAQVQNVVAWEQLEPALQAAGAR